MAESAVAFWDWARDSLLREVAKGVLVRDARLRLTGCCEILHSKDDQDRPEKQPYGEQE
jgi:hypothetical protein